MQWVFDASVTFAWCFEDERTAETDELLDRLTVTPAAVPQIWPLGVANVLILATKKGRLTVAQRAQFLATLAALPIHVDPYTPGRAFADIIPLAEAHGLTAYDASYLELAVRLGVPLATSDQPLRAAAQAAGVPLLG